MESEDCCKKTASDKDRAGETSKKTKKDLGRYLLIGIAIVILVFAFGQTMQIGSIQEKMAAENFAASWSSSGAATGVQNIQKSAPAVPAMVGGC